MKRSIKKDLAKNNISKIGFIQIINAKSLRNTNNCVAKTVPNDHIGLKLF